VPIRARFLAAPVALLLALDAAAVAHISAPVRPPSFRRGGAFAVAGTGGRPFPYSPLVAPDAATVTTVPATTTSSLAVVAPKPRASIATTTTTTRAPGATAPRQAEARPPLGTYTYAVTGWESATGFGKRDYPAAATMDVHTSPDAGADELVYDLVLSSQHSEREIVAFRTDGVSFTFEGGSVTFGPATQTSQADYRPPMLQVPRPLAAGVKRTGTTNAVASDGSTSRVEDWTVTVVGQEGPDWVVDLSRQSRPGSSESVTRNRRYWVDPARALWIKWHETMHAERPMFGFTFTYDTDYTAVLSGSPS
jgi:hypothetical protein